jgi:hypothetical protein
MLVDKHGKPLSSSQYKKAKPPKMGEQFGVWAGDNVSIMTLPGGGAITFDLSRLTMADFRQMKDHYQINSSLSILTFMMHQMEWHIDVDGPKKIADRAEEQLQDIWSPLVRAMSQSFWAGYSPNILQWENDVQGQQVVLDKVKDLIPEDCKVKWKEVKGDVDPQSKVAPTFKVYDGIVQYGAPKPIPVDNSFWYPLLMENGDYYGKKLLRPAFQSWFFSILLHLFANRYYERYGEPTPVGRAPYEDEITIGGETMKGNQLMQLLLTQLRNRSTVVLPHERTPFGQEQQPQYDYQIEYLESQMRGADFERYMTRLDEEMSLALFTPILMMRTADVGSYNLGVGHTQVYLWMLNAICGDWARYINKYILSPITNWNFGVNAPRPKIKFSKMGKVNTELLRTIVSEMMKQGHARPSVQELSEIAGLTFQEFETVTKPDNTGDSADRTGEADDTADGDGALGGDSVRSTMKLITDRIAPQIRKAHKSGTLQGFKPEFGFKKRMEIAMREAGVKDPVSETEALYRRMEMIADNLGNSASDLPSADSYLRIFNNLVNAEASVAA